MARFSRLFRSKSESDAILGTSPKSSPKTSPKPSPGAPHRRRFVRVVRNAESEGEEYENPHVVRKFSKDYWESTQMPKSQSLETVDRPLPYTVSGNTILKKHGSVDSDSSPPTCPRHAIFKEDVQVIEFDKKEKIKKRICYMHDEKLQDSSDDTDSSSNPDFELRRHRIKGKRVPKLDDEEDTEATDSELCITSASKEDLTLNLVDCIEVNGSVCSPVKEEEESDYSGSEGSSDFSCEAEHKRDWTEEDDISRPSIAAKIMSVHAEMQQQQDQETKALLNES